MSTFAAKFPGRCKDCGERIAVGSEVLYNVRDELVHVECLDVDQKPLKPKAVCQICFMEMPCFCEEDS